MFFKYWGYERNNEYVTLDLFFYDRLSQDLEKWKALVLFYLFGHYLIDLSYYWSFYYMDKNEQTSEANQTLVE